MSIGEANPRKPIGVLLAAGRGRRMGRTKQLMPWPPGGETPLVASSFDAIDGVCDQMIVVFGHEAGAVSEALGGRSFHAVQGDADAEMLQSIRLGLRAAQELDPDADVLLHPADHPTVAPETLRRLVDALAAHAGRAVMPEHEGRGGHPVLVPAAMVSTLRDLSGPGGLRQYWADHREACVRVDVDDPSVVRDLDTIDDYRGTPRPPR